MAARNVARKSPQYPSCSSHSIFVKYHYLFLAALQGFLPAASESFPSALRYFLAAPWSAFTETLRTSFPAASESFPPALRYFLAAPWSAFPDALRTSLPAASESFPPALRYFLAATWSASLKRSGRPFLKHPGLPFLMRSGRHFLPAPWSAFPETLRSFLDALRASLRCFLRSSWRATCSSVA